MEIARYLSHPIFKRNTRQVVAGERLFRQGDKGHTLIVVLHGKIRLLAETPSGKQFSVGLVAEGGILGEKALLNREDFVRSFTAQAVANSTILELGIKEIAEVQRKLPHFLEFILIHFLGVFENRLDRANQLVEALRHENHQEKVWGCAQYLAETIGQKESRGIRISQLCENIRFYLELDRMEIDRILQSLASSGLLVQMGSDDFLIPTEKIHWSLESLPAEAA